MASRMADQAPWPDCADCQFCQANFHSATGPVSNQNFSNGHALYKWEDYRRRHVSFLYSDQKSQHFQLHQSVPKGQDWSDYARVVGLGWLYLAKEFCYRECGKKRNMCAEGILAGAQPPVVAFSSFIWDKLLKPYQIASPFFAEFARAVTKETKALRDQVGGRISPEQARFQSKAFIKKIIYIWPKTLTTIVQDHCWYFSCRGTLEW